ncbi:pimeloyl-ACP methyl ester carboxylesterase [Catenuloplanes nepalensis]|uniref:Pimeloyl-ACP methyl ester carboxylesterase n=1 Tax=Catenuloplanes nepalensis TaxID=587533 RepID=A0ABT9ML95_9ACTN|nr:alpha/beta hydrolase [Catenuloplanes nepalensis]MDP9792189.1 pimeloyl-ACP methyl ester carboxylesterase [Catenuloplanes nepalensis]
MTGRMLMTALVAVVLWAYLPMLPVHHPSRVRPRMAATIAGTLAGCATPHECARRIDRLYTVGTASMRAAGQPYASWAGRTFLGFDPRGDGQAAEVFGDLATAERITIVVPGVATTLDTFTRGLGNVARRAPAVQARAVHEAALAHDPHARVAVIAWLGYDPPDGVGVSAAREEVARSGARALTQLLSGLGAARPGVPVTLVGHSYGAIVAGLAVRAGAPAVTDLVALGAPGIGAAKATDFPGVRVWAARADADWIARVPAGSLFGFGHGTPPAAASFGALPLPTAPSTVHDAYLTAESPTLPAVAALALPGVTAH